MELSFIIDYLIISIIASIAINSILRNFATQKKIFVDLPDKNRKFHRRPTPVTGGIGILIAMLISSKIYIDLNNLNGYVPEFTYNLVIASVPLLILFLIDDYRGLLPAYRLLIQVISSLYIIYTTDVYLIDLGNLFGFGEIKLGSYGVPVTLFCIVGLMNAFNMIDGLNGLCAGCGMASMALVGFYSGLVYDSMLILLVGSVIGFLIFNLRIFGKDRGVFLGDSGSNLIGFWVAWISIYASQNDLYTIYSITLVWFVAIPMLDCVSVILLRLLKQKNVASAGRDHIHHKLLERYSSQKTLLIIIILSLFNGLVGIYLNNSYPIYVSTYCFVIFSLAYYTFSYFYENTNVKLKDV